MTSAALDNFVGLAVGGSSLQGFQSTLIYGMVYPQVFIAIRPFLLVVGQQCSRFDVITEIFVTAYLSLDPCERRRFAATLIEVQRLPSSISITTPLHS